MHLHLAALVCLATAVPSVLSLGCCIPELVSRIQDMAVEGVVEQQISFGSYDVCTLSKCDADYFDSVSGEFCDDDTLEVTVNRKLEPVGVRTRSYTLVDNGDCTYEQTDNNSGDSFTIYQIASCDYYTAYYGCSNKAPCDGTQFVQCAFPKGADSSYHAECKAALDSVVGDYIDTVDICNEKSDE